MHFQFIVAPPTPALNPPAPPAAEGSSELLRQMLEVQREQLTLMQEKAEAAESDGNGARWRNFFARWHEEYPELPITLRDVLPAVEKAFIRLVDEMTSVLKDEDSGNLDNDFSLGEFLDRYAMRTGQLGTILNLLGQMADASREE